MLVLSCRANTVDRTNCATFGETGRICFRKKVLRARRTGGLKCPENQKSEQSNPRVQIIGEVKYIAKTRLKMQNQNSLDQHHKGPICLYFLDPRGPPYGAPLGVEGPIYQVWANSRSAAAHFIGMGRTERAPLRGKLACWKC